MKTANQLLSLTMAIVMLFTCTPAVNATNLGDAQSASLREKIAEEMLEAAKAQEDNPYGDAFPSFQQIHEKAIRGVERMQYISSLATEELDKMLRNLSEAEQKELAKTTKKLKEETDKYLVEHQEDFDKYTKGIAKDKKKQMAANTVLLSILGDVDSRKIGRYLERIGIGAELVAYYLWQIAHKLVNKISAATLMRLKEVCIGISAVGLICLLIDLGIMLSSSQSLYFSPEAQGLDCGGFFDKRPCKARHPEQVKKEFLADPFEAVRFFATHSTGEMNVVYLVGPEGAQMLNDTVDIMDNLRRFDMKDDLYQKQTRKMLYIQTLDWQKLSQKEKVAYLHQFAQEAKRDRFKF